jgi:crotonobetainyl-CoA:carnitine CoA-transferase CaiB-like acyl-CoA transferase
MERRLPLEGVRILDLTMAWAGPMAVRILADMGADVIKIEGAGHMDRWRGGTFAQRGTERYPDHDPGPRPWNRSSYANTQNRNKRSLVLDLKHPEGKAIFKRLVPLADIVAENFSAGAMARLGLDYPVLRAIKPDIIMLSMPAFGRTGPEKDYIAHGPTIEEMAGTAFLQGYPDGPPLPSGGLAWGDPIAGIMGAAGPGPAHRPLAPGGSYPLQLPSRPRLQCQWPHARAPRQPRHCHGPSRLLPLRWRRPLGRSRLSQ